MSLEFNPENHEYKLDGVVIPSVTQALKILSDEIYRGISEAVMAAAADRGVKVHLACELHDKGVLDEDQLDPVLAPYLAGWKKFLSETGFIVTHNEAKIWSESFRYAGTLDRVGVFADKKQERVMIDIKARAKLTAETGPQLAGYKAAFEEMHPDRKIKKRFAVNLKKDGKYEMKEYSDRGDLKTFLSCLNIKTWRDKHV